MLGIGAGEILVLLVLGLLVLGPERLPRFAADAARLVKTVRAMVREASEEVRSTLDPQLFDFEDDSSSSPKPRYDDAT